MAMTNTLKFLRTFTLDEFKEWKGILQIRIIRNEQTGKYFFGYGDKAGAITSKYPAEPLDHPVVSEVISEESGEQFLLLHNAGDNPQFTTVATLSPCLSLHRKAVPLPGGAAFLLCYYEFNQYSFISSCNYVIHNAGQPRCGWPCKEPRVRARPIRRFLSPTA